MVKGFRDVVMIVLWKINFLIQPWRTKIGANNKQHCPAKLTWKDDRSRTEKQTAMVLIARRSPLLFTIVASMAERRQVRVKDIAAQVVKIKKKDKPVEKARSGSQNVKNYVSCRLCKAKARVRLQRQDWALVLHFGVASQAKRHPHWYCRRCHNDSGRRVRHGRRIQEENCRKGRSLSPLCARPCGGSIKLRGTK